jgi:hypothetical protein
MDHTLCAVDVQAVRTNSRGRVGSNSSLIQPVPLAQLPVIENLKISGEKDNQAVLSWRWDVDPEEGTSRNVAAALSYASGAGIEHLFIDAVSVDQALSGFDLIRSVADFTKLFGRVPAIAAYDSKALQEDTRHFLRVLRRPWIAREIRAMRYNPHRLRYIGHIADQGIAESFGIAHMLKRIWSTTFANSILYVLTGYCDMHDVSELALIMPEHAAVLAAASRNMSRNDALITAAILSQLSTDEFRVNGDIDIREVGFDRYSFTEVEASPGFWSNWEILLDKKPMGVWSEKDYTMDGDHRRKLSHAENALELFGAYFNVEIATGNLDQKESVPPRQLENQIEDIEIVDFSDRFAT